MTTIQPYLFFEGRAEEAAEFYKTAVNANVQMLMRYSQSPEPCPEGMLPPGSDNKVMHMALKIGDDVVMGSDGFCSGKTDFKGFSLSYTAKDGAEADRAFAALGAGGTVKMPLGETFYAFKFGMLEDKFGLGWMVIFPKPM